MKLYGNLHLICDRCGKWEDEIYYNSEYETKTSIRERAIKRARHIYGWKVTKEKKCYCKECAKILKLRGTKQSGN